MLLYTSRMSLNILKAISIAQPMDRPNTESTELMVYQTIIFLHINDVIVSANSVPIR